MNVLVLNVILLATIMLILALSMSLMRVSRFQPRRGAEADTHIFSKVHKAQQLTAEWAPIFAILLLFIYVQTQQGGQTLHERTKVCAFLATISRLTFVAGCLSTSNIKKFAWVKFWGALLSYVAFFWLIGEAIAYA